MALGAVSDHGETLTVRRETPGPMTGGIMSALTVVTPPSARDKGAPDTYEAEVPDAPPKLLRPETVMG